MIDLTPLDVRKKRGDFRRIMRGYDPVEVDTFLELVESRLETLVMENLSLADRVSRLEASLRTLEGREKAVQDALVTAQKLRDEVNQQSQREVELLKREAQAELDQLRRDARVEVDQLRRDARVEVDRMHREAEQEVQDRLREVDEMVRDRQRALEELERNRRKFLKAFRTLLERELDAVEVEEVRVPLEEAPIELELRGWHDPGLGDEEEDGGEAPFADEPDDADEVEPGDGLVGGWVVELGETLQGGDGPDPFQPPLELRPKPPETLLPENAEEWIEEPPMMVEGESSGESRDEAPEPEAEPHWLSALLNREDREGRSPKE